ncbi:MAG: hypothetical protein ED559_07820 [Phycisphaera sp.]|nr:MAG: hypothetical protein ED559_07820 [Phycisphaera sp.]
MNAKMLFVCASGLAVGHTAAQDQPEIQSLRYSGEVYHAVRATAITGLTLDGRFVYGRTIELGQNTARTTGDVVAYDSAIINAAEVLVCGDVFPHTLSSAGSRYFFGTEFSFQSFSEDIIPASGTEGSVINCVDMLGVRPLCDNGTGTTSEVMQQIVASWEVIDNAFMGGFDPDGDGLVSPFDQNDTDGDTLVDEFNGGIILTYANTDTDGDGVNDEQTSDGANGYVRYRALDLATLGVPLPSGLDRYNSTNGGTDGPDGGIQLIWTRGDGGDGQGPLLGGFYPATRASPMFWGTLEMEAAGTQCPYTDATDPGIGAGSSDGIVWGEGEDLCNDPNNAGGAWSENSSDTEVNDDLDPNNDVQDWFGIVPDFVELGLAIRFRVETDQGQDCCDANGDGACSPADFTAWINAFNNNLPQCDINQDGSCTPADFTAWISAFNDSTAGTPQQCTF